MTATPVRTWLARMGVAAVVAGTGLGLVPVAADAHTPPPTPAYAALQHDLNDGGHGGFRATPGGSRATVWELSQAINADLAVAQQPNPPAGAADRAREALGQLRDYWDGHAYESQAMAPEGPGGYVYYDDNVWIGLDLLKAYSLFHDPADLARARQVFTLEVSGWNRAAEPDPGGVNWTQDPAYPSRNTVSTAGAAELGYRLYLETSEPSYLTWANRMYDWTKATLQLPNGLYADHINPDGSIDRTVWSYNQGLMIAAGVLRNRATGSSVPLQDARRTAAATVNYYSRTGFARESLVFNEILAERLGMLQAVRPTRAVAGAIATLTIEATRATARPRHLVAGPQTPLLEQAGAVAMVANATSLRAGFTPRFPLGGLGRPERQGLAR